MTPFSQEGDICLQQINLCSQVTQVLINNNSYNVTCYSIPSHGKMNVKFLKVMTVINIGSLQYLQLAAVHVCGIQKCLVRGMC